MPPKTTKPPKGPSIPRQPFSRINFLYQASLLLSLPQTTQPLASTASEATNPDVPPSQITTTTATPNPALSRFYINTLRRISMKSVLRLHPNMKRTMCKRCDAHLIPGVTSTVYSENQSKEGHKPWAEMLVVHCDGCGSVKRFPIGTLGNQNEERIGGEQVDVEKRGYKLWCDREDVVEGLVIGGGGGGDCSNSGAGAGAGAGGTGK